MRMPISVGRLGLDILKHPEKKDFISFPNHGTAEMGKGLMKKILKQAGLKKL